MFSERTPVSFSPAQLARLEQIAQREGRSVGAVIRGAIDSYLGGELDSRQRAARNLIEMNAPVEDREVMKAQILASQLDDG